MIWAALLLGATVVLAVQTIRRSSSEQGFAGTRHWLVLPDPPPMTVAALPRAVEPAPSLPASTVIYPSWSGSNEGWRAEKPLRPWFQGAAPYLVAAALGAASFDLSALGMGVPEIAPTHLPLQESARAFDHAVPETVTFGSWSAASADLDVMASSLFDISSSVGADMGMADSHDSFPSWAHQPWVSQDWWA